MGNKNKAPKVGAPAPEIKVQNKKTEEKKTTVESKTKMELGNLSPEMADSFRTGLDPNRYVDLIKVSHETFRMDPDASKHTGIPQKQIDVINKINAGMQVSAMMCEVTLAKNPHNLVLPQQIVTAMIAVAKELDVNVNINMLPAPDENGNVVVPSTAIEVKSEAKKAIKTEAKVLDETPELNPQKITDKEGLRKAAIYVLADAKTNALPYNRISAAIQLYYSWLYFQAADEAAKKELENTSKAVLFKELTEIIGDCPFSMGSIAKLLYNAVSQTKSPISAFCMLRNASLDKTTGNPTIDDQTVADYTKILVNWNANCRIAADKESIETCKNNIEILSKNKKQNKAAIEKENQKIKAYEEAIESYNEIISFVTSPEGSLVESIPAAYFDENHENYKTVRRITNDIFKTYYPGLDIKTVEDQSLKNNAQQYAGVIVNFFRDPLAQLPMYTESNIKELVLKESKKEEEPEEEKTEESSKK